MQIRWHGHSCFEFKDAKNNLLIDPHDGKSIGIKPPVSNANLVLVSNNRFDHSAVRIIKNQYKILFNIAGKHSLNGLMVEGFPSFLDNAGGSERGSNTIYKFTMDGISVCHCGDMCDIPSDDVMNSLKDTDIVFVPTGVVYTIPIPKLKEFLNIIGPKIVVPMHYRVGGLTMPLKTLDDFLESVPDDVIIYVGNEVELFPEDLNEFKGLWVFDR